MIACLYHENKMRQTQLTKGIRVSIYSSLVWKIQKTVWLTGVYSKTPRINHCRAICVQNMVLWLQMQHR